jgi:hypothetical protein
MKSNSLISLNRKGKEIIIYVKEEEFSNIPDLSFIVDVEIIDAIPKTEKINKKSGFFRWFINTKEVLS